MGSNVSPLSIAQRARTASLALQASTAATRSRALLRSAKNLVRHKRAIIAANKADLAQARGKAPQAFLDRLSLNAKRFQEMEEAVNKIARQSDPLNELIEHKKLKSGITLKKVRTAIGVLFIIYEARPHVTADAAALALRAGNAVILKGGSEARNTNRLIAQCFQQALKSMGLPLHAVQFIDTADRTVVKKLLKCADDIDLVVPRGGYGLVKWVRKESDIPSLSHAAGLDHTYVDKSADVPLAIKVIINAKTSFPAACNSLDTLLVHKNIAPRLLPLLQNGLAPYNVELRSDAAAMRIFKSRKPPLKSPPYQGGDGEVSIKAATARDWDTEYLNLTMGIKVVNDVNEAIAHINAHGSRHSESIIARDRTTIALFKKNVDAAGIFVNCSTRLHDGGVFGLGAEMGINTGKLHARGPVGATELTTYKWIAEGSGQIRT